MMIQKVKESTVLPSDLVAELIKDRGSSVYR